MVKENTPLRPFNPSWLDDANLTPQQFRVFMHVVRRDGGDAGCFASLATIAKTCRLSISTARKALASLEKLGMITRDSRSGSTYLIKVCRDYPYQTSTTTPTKVDLPTPTKVDLPPYQTGSTTPTKVDQGYPYQSRSTKDITCKDIPSKDIPNNAIPNKDIHSRAYEMNLKETRILMGINRAKNEDELSRYAAFVVMSLRDGSIGLEASGMAMELLEAKPELSAMISSEIQRITGGGAAEAPLSQLNDVLSGEPASVC